MCSTLGRPPFTCSEVLFSEKGELKKALMVSSTTVSTYFSSGGSETRFSRFLHTCGDGHMGSVESTGIEVAQFKDCPDRQGLK